MHFPRALLLYSNFGTEEGSLMPPSVKKEKRRCECEPDIPDREMRIARLKAVIKGWSGSRELLTSWSTAVIGRIFERNASADGTWALDLVHLFKGADFEENAAGKRVCEAVTSKDAVDLPGILATALVSGVKILHVAANRFEVPASVLARVRFGAMDHRSDSESEW